MHDLCREANPTRVALVIMIQGCSSNRERQSDPLSFWFSCENGRPVNPADRGKNRGASPGIGNHLRHIFLLLTGGVFKVTLDPGIFS